MWNKLFGKKELPDEPVKKSDKNVQQIDETPENEAKKGEGLFSRLKSGLSKTRSGFVEKVEKLLPGRKIDEELFEELEDILIQADVGVNTTMFLTDQIRERVKQDRITDSIEIQAILKSEIVNILSADFHMLSLSNDKPAGIMVVGVNGAGKTTTIGKLAYRLKNEYNAKVVLGAGDTFRAAAIDQLQVWAERIGVDMIAHSEGSDPSAVAFDTVAAAKARNADIFILDTAGRLQTKTNLMSELGKVHRVVTRELGRELDEVLLVVDATTGQNALSQAKLFSESTPVTGIVLTKLDGTAKGGIVLALAHELKIPVKFIGVGEQYTDLQDFDPVKFTDALFT